MVAALNDLEIACADVESAFLTAPNLEQIYLKAGPEFRGDEGKYYIVKKALYGLKSAAAAFRSYLSDRLFELGCKPSVADPDVWMRPAVKVIGMQYYTYIWRTLMIYCASMLILNQFYNELWKVAMSRIKRIKLMSPKIILVPN